MSLTYPPLSASAQALPLKLDELSTLDLEVALSDADRPTAALLPLGSVEPHGPHMPLSTDRLLSEENAERAARRLRAEGVLAFVAPSLAYGVTDYAAGFCGAITLSEGLCTQLLVELARSYHRAGFQHVCLINHHLEPGQLSAIQAATADPAQGLGL